MPDQPHALVVNGAPQTVTADTLAGAIVELGFGDRKVATALNGAFVAVGQRAQTLLKAGDRIEVVSARQGG